MIKNRTSGHTKSAFRAALDPDGTIELTIAANIIGIQVSG
jgi:hypothetical protein